MGLIETAKRFFCLEKWMILISVEGFFQFLPKLVEEKVSSRTLKTMEKTAPWKKLPTLVKHSVFRNRLTD